MATPYVLGCDFVSERELRDKIEAVGIKGEVGVATEEVTDVEPGEERGGGEWVGGGQRREPVEILRKGSSVVLLLLELLVSVEASAGVGVHAEPTGV